ncbi:hypothetical protein ACFORG_15460 [Lutimaribacter marinistellae]|uniref:Lipoprotein n=1 Tax=Lutimaribacter marinistellae TaxID=1820329 RepID=A0ABV7THT0_9RHOB
MALARAFFVAGLFGTLAACGDSVGEQALFGGGAGAVAAGAVNADPVAGAALGAAGNILYCDQNPSDC